MILQSIRMAFESITSNKIRSFLTMLGIIIGVIALVVLVSLVSSASDSVTEQVSTLGTDMLTAMVIDDKGYPLKLDDLTLLESNSVMGQVAPLTQTVVTAKHGYIEEPATLYGTLPAYGEIHHWRVKYGRFLRTTDVDNNSYVAVLSLEAADKLFGQANPINETISLNGRNFKVVGVMEEDTSLMSAMTTSIKIYTPYTVVTRVSNMRGGISNFIATSSNPKSMDEAEEAVRAFLTKRLKGDEDAFFVFNQSNLMDVVGSVTDMMSYLLGGIAAISLLVGGIGIMNIMLVSVTERTKEIGIRKAIGAAKRSILFQFLIEALVVSLMGCAIGIGLSFILLRVATLAAGGLITFYLSPQVVLLAVGFAIAIGVLFGIYPAYKAADKHPIEALRYEG
ncbi:MAG: FtsX-like permease family protein [Clostridiaceae bacterium]|nr:FtsX-like permease family protein [Clostridiaceae bacterium]